MTKPKMTNPQKSHAEQISQLTGKVNEETELMEQVEFNDYMTRELNNIYDRLVDLEDRIYGPRPLESEEANDSPEVTVPTAGYHRALAFQRDSHRTCLDSIFASIGRINNFL